MLKHITDSEFDSAVQSGAVLVDFYADWCGPCKMIAPVLEQLAAEHPALTVLKVNVDESPALAARFGVMSIPTVLYYKDGQMVDQTVGALGKASFAAKVAQIL